MSSPTMEPCETYWDQSIMSVTSYGAICVEPADMQGDFVYRIPSVGKWFQDNWYVIFIVALVVVLCIVSTVLQCVRWCHRIRNRHEREERDKRVDGMIRMMSSSIRPIRSSSKATREVLAPSSSAKPTSDDTSSSSSSPSSPSSSSHHDSR